MNGNRLLDIRPVNRLTRSTIVAANYISAAVKVVHIVIQHF